MMTERTVEVRDEDGNGFDLLQFEDVFVTKSYFDEYMGNSLEEQLRVMKGINYEDGDVMVCSFPKTGTHWVNNLVHMLLSTDQDNIDKACSVSPFFLETSPETSWLSLPSPRVLTTHVKVDRFPSELLAKAKLVFVVRNPKDACVSLFHYYQRSYLASKLSWESMLKQYLHGPVGYGTYAGYLQHLQQQLVENRDFKPHIIFFEAMKTDGLSQLRELQEYLGLDHPDAHLQAVLERCDVSKLRRDVDEGRVGEPLVDNENKSAIYRKGEVGDWKNHFTVAQNKMFDQFWSEKMSDSVFKFKYE